MKRTPKANAFPVMPMAEIQALKQTDRIARFGERANVAQRAFAEMGKLRRAIESSLKPGQDVTNTLRKVGVRDGTISNTSYAARVFDLVEAGHLTEAEYDSFSFADCLAICRAMGALSKQRLDGSQVAVVIRDSKDFDRELNCIYEHGLPLEEKAAKDKAEADAATIAPATSPATGEPSAPAQAPATIEPGTTPAPTAPGIAPAPADPAVEPEAEAPPENVVPSGIAPKAASTASKLAQTLNLLDALELMFADLTVEDARKAYPRLVDLANTVGEFTASTPEEQKSAAKKAKKAA